MQTSQALPQYPSHSSQLYSQYISSIIAYTSLYAPSSPTALHWITVQSSIHTFQICSHNLGPVSGDWWQLKTRVGAGKPRSDCLCSAWRQMMTRVGAGKPCCDGLCSAWRQLMTRVGAGKPRSDVLCCSSGAWWQLILSGRRETSQ